MLLKDENGFQMTKSIDSRWSRWWLRRFFLETICTPKLVEHADATYISQMGGSTTHPILFTFLAAFLSHAADLGPLDM